MLNKSTTFNSLKLAGIALSFLFVSGILHPSPALAWEEGDKEAFLEKIGIMKALVLNPENGIRENLTGE